jgi:osmotically-inducible protein OsmY
MSLRMKACSLIVVLGVAAALQGCVGLVAGGVAAGAVVVSDRRSTGTVIDDEGIENTTLLDVKRKYPDGTHVNITSYNRTVLITGEVFNEAQKKGIEDVVRAHRNVRDVHNELAIMPVASLAAVSGDSALTARVKARLVDTKGVSANHIKVVTERGIVHLLGILNRAEADVATEVARTTSGVQRVVRLFEYTN